jgi:O-antigen/teichoic acid export membrane protein
VSAGKFRADLSGQENYLKRTMPRAPVGVAGSQPAQRAAEAEPASPSSPAGASGTLLAGIARGGTANLAGAAFSAAASVGLTVLVARSFGKSVAGTFFVAMSLFLIVEAVTNLGAYNGTIYFIARLRALHAEQRIPAILRATVIPVVVASVLGACALFVFGSPLARALLGGRLGSGASPGAMASTIRILALALPFAALADTMLGATRGYHEMRPTVVVDRICRSGFQLAGIAVAVLIGSSAALAPLWALPYIPAAACAALWLRWIARRAETAPIPGQPRAAGIRAAADQAAGGGRHGEPDARGFWRFTAPRSVASVAQIVIQRLDIVLVGIMMGPGYAAVYTAATRFLVAGQLGNAAISMAAQPQLTRLFAVRDRLGANAVYQATTAWLILLTWPLYLLAVVFGPEVLAIFGHSYRAGGTVMVILAIAMLVGTGCGQVDMVLITTGRSTWSLWNGLSAMIVNVGADLLLIPRLGITGAAIGWAAAIAVTNLVPLVQVAVAARVHPFGPGTACACALTLLSFGVIPVAMRAVAGASAAASLGAAAVGCCVMAAGLWSMRGFLHLSVLAGLSRTGRATRTVRS